MKDAPKGSAQRLKRLSYQGHHAGPIQWHTLAAPHILAPTALINDAAFPAQLLQCPSFQPQERGHSPTAASQGWRWPDPEKVLSSPAEGVQNLCPLSEPLICLCITWVPLSRAHAGVHALHSACTLHVPSPPSQPSGPCTAWQAHGPGRRAQWVELS